MSEFELSFDVGLLKRIIFGAFMIFIFASELSVTLNNPIVFGDEGYHVSVARHMAQDIAYPSQTPLSVNSATPENLSRPPFWNLLEASFYMMFGFNETIVKVLVPLMAVMTGVIIYALGRRLYSENMAMIAAVIAVTIPSFVTYSLVFYTTVPYMFFFTLGFLTLMMAIKTEQRKWWVLGGLFSGVAVLANIAGLFLPILAVCMALIKIGRDRGVKNIISVAKTYGLAIIIIFLLISPLFVRNFALYRTEGCNNPWNILQDTCRVPGSGYVQVTENEFVGRNTGGGTEGSILSIGVVGYLAFAYGFGSANQWINMIGILFIPFSFLAGLVILAKWRRDIDIALLVSALIFLVLFWQLGGLTDGRSEDAARYFLSAVPMIALSAGAYWSSVNKEGHRLNWLIFIAVFAVILLLSYTSFAQKAQTMDNVKDFIPSFFKACDWVKYNLPEDAKMLSFQTYPTRYNCDRAAVWELPDKGDIILSNDVDLVKDRLRANKIDYIFVQKFALSNAALGQSYPVSFVNFLESDNRTFIKLYENGPPYGTPEFSQCISSGGCDPGNIIYQVNFVDRVSIRDVFKDLIPADDPAGPDASSGTGG